MGAALGQLCGGLGRLLLAPCAIVAHREPEVERLKKRP